MVESQPSKLLVAGSIPVSRSNFGSGTSSPDPYRRRLRGPVAPLRFRRGAPLARLGDWNWKLRAGSWQLEAGHADVAQLAERVLGKDEVTSSILVIGSKKTTFGRVR